MRKRDLKVLFVCKQRVDSYGISFGLLNSAKMLAKTLNNIGVNAEVVSPVDANGIDKEVFNKKPSHVIIHALWVTPQKIDELCRRYPKVSWNIRIHSKPAFLAMEGIASDWIAEYVKIQELNENLFLSANSHEMDIALVHAFNANSLMLPNAYVEPSPCQEISKFHIRYPAHNLNIACFGAIRPLKNHYAQAIAAILFANKIGRAVSFHVNKGREEQGGDRVVRNLRGLFNANPKHSLIEHDWYDQCKLVHEILPMMDLGMQVSLTETFNIVAADMVSAGIPTIGSNDIYWMSSCFHADPNDIEDMVEKMERARFFGKVGVFWNKTLLAKNNKIAEDIWLKGLCRTIV